MAFPNTMARSLFLVELHTILESDDHDRLEQIIESLAAYSIISDIYVDEFPLTNMLSVLQ